jgi:putative Mn2+ efflux pump MntP
MQFLKWVFYIALGTALTVITVGVSLLFSLIGAVIGIVALGSTVALLLGLLISEWWQSKKVN